MNKNLKLTAYLFLVVALLEVFGLFFGILKEGLGTFIFYTRLSNLFTFFMSVWGISVIKTGVFKLRQQGLAPEVFAKLTFADVVKAYYGKSTGAFVTLRYWNAAMLLMTTFTTVFVLIPTGGDWQKLLFKDSGLFHHTLCPLLSLYSYIVREKHAGAKAIWLPVGFTFAYGVVMLVLNYLYLYSGPYFFFRVHDQSAFATFVWMVILTGIIAVLSVVLYAVARSVKKQQVVHV